MTSPATSVSNLDIDQLVADAVSRGYIQTSWYLIDVEAGFELWQGGAGLATNSFSVNTAAPRRPPARPRPAPARHRARGRHPTPTGRRCSVTYSLVNTWPAASRARRWSRTPAPVRSAAGTWPGRSPATRRSPSFWNGTYTQSGEAVRVTNASYNATIAPGGTVTVGFTGTFTSNDTSPSAFTLNGTPCG